MKKTLAFLTANWGLKLLALVLAIILYHAVKNGVADRDSAAPAPSHERQPPER